MGLPAYHMHSSEIVDSFDVEGNHNSQRMLCIYSSSFLEAFVKSKFTIAK